MGGFCCGIAAAQRPSQGDPARGQRHECRLRQGSERQPRECPGGVRQVPRHPEYGGGVRPGPEGREPGRHREAGPAGTDAVDVAQEPGELDGEGNPEVGVDGPGTVCDGHSLRDEAGASRHLRAEGCRGGQEAVPKRVRLGACNAGTDRGFARADGAHSPDDRRALGGDLGPLDSRPDDRFHGGSQQPVLGREAAGTRIPGGGVYDGHALLCRRETHPPVLLTH